MPPSQWVILRHERFRQIVSPQEWAKVQEIRRERGSYARGRRADATPYLLVGLLHCVCGGRMCGMRKMRGAVKYYECRKCRDQLRYCSVKAETLDKAVIDECRAILTQLWDKSDEIKQRVAARVAQARAAMEREIHALEGERRAIERERMNLRRSLGKTDNEGTRRFLLSEIDKLSERYEQVTRQLDLAREDVRREVSALEVVDVEAEIRKALEHLDTTDVTPVRQIVQDILAKVVFDKARRTLTLEWKLDSRLLALLRHLDPAYPNSNLVRLPSGRK